MSSKLRWMRWMMASSSSVEISSGWDSLRAVGACPSIKWHGDAWRHHAASRQATSSLGSLMYSGRYHRGKDQFDPSECWEALYLSLGRDIVLGELIRHLGMDGKIAVHNLRSRRISRLRLDLSNVIDCSDVVRMGIRMIDLFPEDEALEDAAYDLGQDIGSAAFILGYEAMLIPSATRLGTNLIVFPANLRPDSHIQIIDSVDPALYVPARHGTAE